MDEPVNRQTFSQIVELTFRLPKVGGTPLWFFAYHTCCIWDESWRFR